MIYQSLMQKPSNTVISTCKAIVSRRYLLDRNETGFRPGMSDRLYHPRLPCLTSAFQKGSVAISMTRKKTLFDNSNTKKFRGFPSQDGTMYRATRCRHTHTASCS